MANKKLGPVEGEVCWFCKMPSDDESWMGLGMLKSTNSPIFHGRYILYHECCAVFSCGAEDIPTSGMEDETVLNFYRHGEKAAGIGLKCQLCGKRGATTGCFYGPCQQFYHFTCARVRAYLGDLSFSLDGKRLACMEHASLLPLPHEVDFMGMWMEGVGSWNGTLMEEANEQWHPAYQAYHAQFLQQWDFLLNTTPVAEVKLLQEMKKESYQSTKRKGTFKDDPDYRAKGNRNNKPKKSQQGRKQQQQRTTDSGGAAATTPAAAPDTLVGAAAGKAFRQHHMRQPHVQLQPQGWYGVPDDVVAAAAAMAEQAKPDGVSAYRMSSWSNDDAACIPPDVFSPTSSDPSRQQAFSPRDWQPQQQQCERTCSDQVHKCGPQPRSLHTSSAGGGAAAKDLHDMQAAGQGGRWGSNVDQQVWQQSNGQNAHDVHKQTGQHTRLNFGLLLAAAGFQPIDDVPCWPTGSRGANRQHRSSCQHQHQQEYGATRPVQQQQPACGMLSASRQSMAGAQKSQCAGIVEGQEGHVAAALDAGGESLTRHRSADCRPGPGAPLTDVSASPGTSGLQLPQAEQVSTDQKQGAGPAAGVRYTAGALQGPQGVVQEHQACKELDVNILAHTDRKQLSVGVLQAAVGLPQQQEADIVAASAVEDAQHQHAAVYTPQDDSALQQQQQQQPGASSWQDQLQKEVSGVLEKLASGASLDPVTLQQLTAALKAAAAEQEVVAVQAAAEGELVGAKQEQDGWGH